MAGLRRLVNWLVPRSSPSAELVVAVAENEPQAEMMTQLLREAGIPSNYQSIHGVSLWAPWNPIGPREIIVTAADAARAKQILSQAGHPHHERPRKPRRRQQRGHYKRET